MFCCLIYLQHEGTKHWVKTYYMYLYTCCIGAVRCSFHHKIKPTTPTPRRMRVSRRITSEVDSNSDDVTSLLRKRGYEGDENSPRKAIKHQSASTSSSGNKVHHTDNNLATSMTSNFSVATSYNSKSNSVVDTS